MDSLTKTLVTKSNAYNSAFWELKNQDSSIIEVEYFEGTDTAGSFVRGYYESVGYSSKYYYAA